jgi:methylmalonyl-CoA/ethylmalonyl-CoA epimerase
MITGIKHMAFAVRDANAALDAYQRLLGLGHGAPVKDYPKSRTRTALLQAGEVEIQLCQSLDADGRFAEWIDQRGGEGLHHICFAVEDIEGSIQRAVGQGAKLKECRACKVMGVHSHPEGYIAFLADEVSGIELEFMQVYKPGEGQVAQQGV